MHPDETLTRFPWFSLSGLEQFSSSMSALQQMHAGDTQGDKIKKGQNQSMDDVLREAAECPTGNGFEGSTGLHRLVQHSAALCSIYSRGFCGRSEYSIEH